MEYTVGESGLDAAEFIAFACRVWPADYTINLTAREGGALVGCLRILTDGCFFGTITELLVLPEYRRRGIGSALLRLAREHTPTMLYFGAQPGLEGFYERNGCRPSLSSYVIEPRR